MPVRSAAPRFPRRHFTRLVTLMSSLTTITCSSLLSRPQLYYTLSSIAALIILSLAYSRFCGLFGQDKNMSLTVKWGRERLVSFSVLFFQISTPNMPRVHLASPSPSPHLSHPPFCLITTSLIRPYAASRSPFLHSIPNSPYSAKLYRNTPIFPLILSNSSMQVPS